MKTTRVKPPPVSERPKCRRCGKPLQLHTWWFDSDSEQPPAIGTKVPFGSRGHTFTVMAIMRSRAKCLTGGDKWSHTFWTGHFGVQGDDYFCTLGCGFQWACMHLDRERGY